MVMRVCRVVGEGGLGGGVCRWCWCSCSTRVVGVGVRQGRVWLSSGGCMLWVVEGYM
jgi:hypothetical protein